MSTLLIIFIASFVLLVLILGIRLLEIKNQKNVVPEKIFDRVDLLIEKIIKWFYVSFRKFSRNIKGWFKDLPKRINDVLHVWWQKVSYKIDKYFYKLRKRDK